MQKIQMLSPDPMMKRLRAIARQQDRPVSGPVRPALDRLLEQVPVPAPKQPARFPTFHGGGVLVADERLKDVLHGVEGEARTASRGDSRRHR